MSPVDDVKRSEEILDLETGLQKIESLEWPIVGHLPLSVHGRASAPDEPRWITNYTAGDVERIADWRLAGRRGLPPNMSAPYQGYTG